jgi:2-methylcitrate dehydratase PrpD
MTFLSGKLAKWAHATGFDDLPADVVESTRFRMLDVIGLALAGLGTGFGRSVRNAALALAPGGPARLLGTGERVGVTSAALTNGALSQAMEFDDTHNESIVHMSGPAVATGLALAEIRPISGRDLIAAIAIGNEISCRVGSVAPGQFHKRGFHPTGLFATFGTTYLAGKLLGLAPAELANAAGIAGSFASGILECWVDGTQSKYLHPGWAAQSGITAAFLADAGATGPEAVFEGRFGLIASHLQDADAEKDFGRIDGRLGTFWESQRASFKPFPAAHVIHPYIDAILRLRREHAIDPAAVARIVVPVAPYILPIVCEPVAEKRRPRSDAHGRVSMQYTLAEALYAGRLGKDAYGQSALENPAILRLADLVEVEADPSFPGPERFKGAIRIVMADGAVREAIEEHNRGSSENPMTTEEIVGKFDENASDVLTADRRRRLVDAVADLDSVGRADVLIDLAVGS